VEDNRWRWVGDNTWLFVESLGEDVNTEIPVLAGLRGSSDADDLTWAVLEDDQVTNADVVARDGEGGGLLCMDRRHVARLVTLVSGGRVDVFFVNVDLHFVYNRLWGGRMEKFFCRERRYLLA